MACLPLIERELRVAVRKHRPAQSRFKVASLAVWGSALVLLIGSLFGSRSMGRTLETLLCIAGLYCVVRAPALIAGVLAEERRNQTLGLLFLSGLSPAEVFASKFLSSALVVFSNLLAIFPLLALPFLLGGVSFDLYIATVCGLPVLMFFVLAVSLLASALTREDGAAVILANVPLVLLCALPPAIFLAQSHFSSAAAPSLWWLRVSPAYAPRLVWSNFRGAFPPGDQFEFWLNLAVTVAWSAIALAGAAFALKRAWREDDGDARSGGWRERWREFLHGNRARRQRLSRRWLDTNPFAWLAARDRQPATLGWLVIGGMVLVWLIAFAAWPAQWATVPSFFITATIMNSALAWLIRQAAAQEIGLARRDGAYEILLTTPLEPSDIVAGVFESLRCHFRPLVNGVLCLNVLAMFAGLSVRTWTQSALVVYFIVWSFLLVWTWSLGREWPRLLPVMWVSLNCGRPAYAVWRASGFNGWSWFWILFNLRGIGRGFQRFPTGSLGEAVLVAAVGFVLFVVLVAKAFRPGRANAQEIVWDPKAKIWRTYSAARLILEFREIVREPLPEPGDPRYKSWNIRERFPWGWELVQQQLHERVARRAIQPTTT